MYRPKKMYPEVLHLKTLSLNVGRCCQCIFFIVFNFFRYSCGAAKSCPCDFVPCTQGTYSNTPNVSVCSLAQYYAFEPGNFLQESTGRLDPLRPYLRNVNETAPSQASNCLFSSGCASFDNGGFEASNFSIGSSAGFSICLWYKVGSRRAIWQRLFDFGEGPSSDNILLTRYFDCTCSF